MDGIVNISTKEIPPTSPFIVQFEKHLEAEKVSKNTIKNYLSDIKQFISWLEEKNQSLIT
jgi:site-specific recombinase XerD